MDKIICPYCGDVENEYLGNDFEADGDSVDIQCGSCDKKFRCTLNIIYDYDCEKIGEVYEKI